VIGFVGQYEHQMDAKGRVSLPSAFRRQGDGERFVLMQWESANLTLFPQAKWEELQQDLLDFRRKNPRGANQLRRLVANAVEVSPDKQGRILVPAALQAGAGLSGGVLLVGAIDRVEIWDPETYHASVDAEGGDLGDFAHQLFG
jgi:MraZ protein